MNAANKVVQYGLKEAFGYIEKNPEENQPKLMNWVDRIAGNGPNSFPVQRAAFRYLYRR